MTFTVTAAQFVAAPYNCPTDGTSDCRVAFLTFKAAAQGLDSVLNIPAGHTYKFLATGGPTADSFIFSGIPSLIVDAGAGATFNPINNIGWGNEIGIDNGAVGTCSARTQTAFAGQSTITLINHTDAALFAVGRVAAMTACALQPSGDPAHQYLEWITPLTQTYLSTFPNYDPGTSSSQDQGGPATLYKFRDEWHASIEFRGITFDAAGLQTYCKLRDATFVNCSVLHQNTLIPTMNKTFTIRGSSSVWTGTMEVDKFLGTITVDQGANAGTMAIQCPSPQLLLVDNGTVQLASTPLNTVIRNGSTIPLLQFGSLFGNTNSVQVSDSTVSSMQVLGSPFASIEGATLTSSVLTYPFSGGVLAGMAPGLKMMRSNLNSENGFRVSDVQKVGSNTAVYTNLPGSTLPTLPGSPRLSGPHPCPHVRFTNVTGCAEAIKASYPGAYDRPLHSYAKWVITADLAGNTDTLECWGIVKSIIVNVTVAAAGTLHILAPGDNYPVILANGSKSTFAPTVNLSVSGSHTIDLSGGPYWFTGPATPAVASPTTARFTIEIITDPGIGRTFSCTFA
jgi:hypothetical protein